MKTNLSSCCNAEVVNMGHLNIAGCYYECVACDKPCDLASPEVIEKWSELKEEYNNHLRKKWKERGFEVSPETAMVYDESDADWWISKLSTQEKELREKIEKMETKKFMTVERDGVHERYYVPIDKILGLINKDK